MVREQEVLRGGSPLSVAVTVRVYSARSEWLRGDDERSSPVFGFKEKRSALGPGRDRESKLYSSFNWRQCLWENKIHKPSEAVGKILDVTNLLNHGVICLQYLHA